MSLLFIGIALFSFAATAVGVPFFRAFVLKKGVIDTPNERSSHTIPTPRGGGLVMAAAILLGYIAGGVLAGYSISAGYLIGAALVIGISILDDIYSLPSPLRFGIHFIAATTVIYLEKPFAGIEIPLSENVFSFGWAAIPLTVLWIVWLTNAYNFMDGIDGIAGIQAVAAGLGWAIFLYPKDLSGPAQLAAVTAAAAMGFLIHNWQPAKIFMGDAGSAFLGFTFAVMPLIFGSLDPKIDAFLPLIAIGMVWPFFFDSVYTLVRRVLRLEPVWRAHRSHLYQKMVISGMSHRSVTTLYGAFAIITALIFGICYRLKNGITIGIALCAVEAVFLIVFVHFRVSRERERPRVQTDET